MIAGGVGLVGLYLMRRDPSRPMSFADMYDTLMPNAMDQNQLANWFAARSGGQPSPAGTSGTGATATAPAYAGGIASLGTALTNLFARMAGPGNTNGPDQPRASSSSGGGVAQPVPGIAFEMYKPGLYLPNTDWADMGIDPLNINSGLYDAPQAIYSQNASADIPYYQ